VEVLSSRILLRPADLGQSQHFYKDVLGLAIYREFGSPADPGVVFFLGSGFLEVSGHSVGGAGHSMMIWLQVRDINAEHVRLAAAGVRILREPATESWGLTEMWIEDPDGVRIVLVEVPAGHPLRRDRRSPPGGGPRHSYHARHERVFRALPPPNRQAGKGRSETTFFMTSVEFRRWTPGRVASTSSSRRWYAPRSAVTIRRR